MINSYRFLLFSSKPSLLLVLLIDFDTTCHSTNFTLNSPLRTKIFKWYCAPRSLSKILIFPQILERPSYKRRKNTQPSSSVKEASTLFSTSKKHFFFLNVEGGKGSRSLRFGFLVPHLRLTTTPESQDETRARRSWTRTRRWTAVEKEDKLKQS